MWYKIVTVKFITNVYTYKFAAQHCAVLYFIVVEFVR